MKRNILSAALGLPAQRRQPIRQMIGRVRIVTSHFWKIIGRTLGLLSIDQTQPDYAFWDKLRRGAAAGYKMSGLFVKPITQTFASFVLGSGVHVSLKHVDSVSADEEDHTNALLARFAQQNHSMLQTMLEDHYALGDQFVVVNVDGTLSVPSPDTVTVEYEPFDYRKMMRLTIRTELPETVITDVYTAAERTVTIENRKSAASVRQPPIQRLTFANLIGQIPVVHFANERSANETNGRPIAEPLLPVLGHYEDILTKAATGAQVMGNPIPIIEGVEDLQTTLDMFTKGADEEYQSSQDTDFGHTQTRKTISVDPSGGLVIGKGGSFKFAAPPGGFTDDARNMLKAFFLLILDYTRMPEVLWGGAISSSKASAEVQMPPFYQYVEMLRVKFSGTAADDLLNTPARGGLHELIDIWLRMRRLTDLQVIVAPVEIAFPPLQEEDKSNIRAWVQLLVDRGLITDEMAVRLSGLIDDPAGEVEAARFENDARQAAFEEQTMSGSISRLAREATSQAA